MVLIISNGEIKMEVSFPCRVTNRNWWKDDELASSLYLRLTECLYVFWSMVIPEEGSLKIFMACIFSNKKMEHLLYIDQFSRVLSIPSLTSTHLKVSGCPGCVSSMHSYRLWRRKPKPPDSYIPPLTSRCWHDIITVLVISDWRCGRVSWPIRGILRRPMGLEQS